MDINYKGEFTSIEAVWERYPEGGIEGDYLYINSVKYRWNKYDCIWENAETVTDSPARRIDNFDGDVHVQNDLVVGGTLRAKKVKQPNCGLFATEAALNAAFPKPEVGMWAAVGDTLPADIYRCNTEGVWEATGEVGPTDTREYGNVLSYKSAVSTGELPFSPTADEKRTGYLIGSKLYVWVGTGGDVLDGKYKDCGEFKGPQGNSGVASSDGIESWTNLDDPEDIPEDTEQLVNVVGAKVAALMFANRKISDIFLSADGKKITIKKTDGTEVEFQGGREILDVLKINNIKDSIYISDQQGNVLAKFSQNGLKVTSLSVLFNGTLTNLLTLLASKVDVEEGKGLSTEDFTSELKEKLESCKELTDLYENYYKDELHISDQQGNVFLSIKKKEGEYVLDYYGKESTTQNWLKGKTIASIGDSLSSGGYWQTELAQITGAIFDQELNYGGEKKISQGGTRTLDDSGECGMDRARNLLELKPDIDVIIVQNINDMNAPSSGTTETDVPFMLKNNILHDITYPSQQAADSALSSVIASTTPAVGTMIRLPYSTNGKQLSVSSAATGNGTISITINGSTISTPVINSGDSISAVVNKIASTDFVTLNCGKYISGNSVIIYPLDNTPINTFSTDAGTTGVSLSNQQYSAEGKRSYCFISYDISDWNDTSKWVLYNTITLRSIYKGFIEYLYTNFPNAKIFFSLFPRQPWTTKEHAEQDPEGTARHNFAFKADGSFDFDRYNSDNRNLRQIQKEVCDYMYVPIIDVAKECGINIFNSGTFYPEWNVHFNQDGYKRVGQSIARVLTGK